MPNLIGKARYKDHDEERAREYEAKYSGKEKQINFEVVNSVAVYEIQKNYTADAGKSSKNKHPQPPAPPRWRNRSETGTIEPGKCADFIVTAKNPLEDLRALRQIEMVVAKGRKIDHPQVKT